MVSPTNFEIQVKYCIKHGYVVCTYVQFTYIFDLKKILKLLRIVRLQGSRKVTTGTR